MGKGLPPESKSGAFKASSRQRAHKLVRKYSDLSSSSIEQQQAMQRYPFSRAMNGHARLNHGSSLLPFPFGIRSAFARTKPEVGQLVTRGLTAKDRRSIQMGRLERREDLRGWPAGHIGIRKDEKEPEPAKVGSPRSMRTVLMRTTPIARAEARPAQSLRPSATITGEAVAGRLSFGHSRWILKSPGFGTSSRTHSGSGISPVRRLPAGEVSGTAFSAPNRSQATIFSASVAAFNILGA